MQGLGQDWLPDTFGTRNIPNPYLECFHLPLLEGKPSVLDYTVKPLGHVNSGDQRVARSARLLFPWAIKFLSLLNPLWVGFSVTCSFSSLWWWKPHPQPPVQIPGSKALLVDGHSMLYWNILRVWQHSFQVSGGDTMPSGYQVRVPWASPHWFRITLILTFNMFSPQPENTLPWELAN